MRRPAAEARAIFHDRTAMEHAVRALELEGVRRRRISIARADATGGVHQPPEASSALSIGGAVGSAIGAVLALLSLAWAVLDPPFYVIVVRVLVGAATGAILGALVALVTSRLRRESRYQHPAGYRDFLVKVKARDPVTAENVRDLLARAGGDVLPA